MAVSISLGLTGAGCRVVGDAVQGVAYQTHTAITESREWHRNKKLAAESWNRTSLAATASADYADGYQDGFAMHLYRGTLHPPILPPSRYRKAQYQTPQGYQAAEEWLLGYEHGIRDAQAQGLRQSIVGPTSLSVNKPLETGEFNTIVVEPVSTATNRPHPVPVEASPSAVESSPTGQVKIQSQPVQAIRTMIAATPLPPVTMPAPAVAVPRLEPVRPTPPTQPIVVASAPPPEPTPGYPVRISPVVHIRQVAAPASPPEMPPPPPPATAVVWPAERPPAMQLIPTLVTRTAERADVDWRPSEGKSFGNVSANWSPLPEIEPQPSDSSRKLP